MPKLIKSYFSRQRLLCFSNAVRAGSYVYARMSISTIYLCLPVTSYNHLMYEQKPGFCFRYGSVWMAENSDPCTGLIHFPHHTRGLDNNHLFNFSRFPGNRRILSPPTHTTKVGNSWRWADFRFPISAPFSQSSSFNFPRQKDDRKNEMTTSFGGSDILCFAPTNLLWFLLPQSPIPGGLFARAHQPQLSNSCIWEKLWTCMYLLLTYITYFFSWWSNICIKVSIF